MKKQFSRIADSPSNQLRDIIVLIADSYTLEKKASEALYADEKENHLEVAMCKIETALSIIEDNESLKKNLRRELSVGHMNSRLDHLHRLHQESRHSFDNTGITEKHIASKNNLALQ